MTSRTVPRRAAWGIADQGFSSLTNFALAAIVARNTSPEEFGGFAIIFSTYILILGVSRAMTTLPILVRFSAATPARWRSAAAAATGATVLIGLAAGAACAVAGAAFPGTRAALFALAVCLPGLLLQESWRHAFIARGTPPAALVNDAAWALFLVPAMALAVVGSDGSAWAFVLAWGVAGSLAAVVGIAQARVLPAPSHALGWVKDHHDLSSRQVGEFLANTGSTQIVMYAAAALAGLSAAGALRGAQVLLGPLNVLFQGVWIIGLSELVRVLNGRPHLFTRGAVALSAVLGTAGVVYTTVFLVFGDQLGPVLLGQTWEPAQAVLVPLSLAAISSGLWLGATVGLRALQEASRSLRARLVVSGMNVVGGIVGLLVGGARGAAWGLGVTSLLGVVIWWRQFLRAPSRALGRPLGADVPEPIGTPATEGVA